MDEASSEHVIISKSPEIVVSKVANSRRNSTGQAITRYSLSISNGAEKILPHYLRASTNSCHDFCKYGRQHVFEAKEKHLIPCKEVTRDVKKSEIVNLGGKKKKPLFKLKGMPEYKIDLVEKPKIKQKALPSVKKTEISIKPGMASKQRSLKAKSPSSSSFSGAPSGRSSMNSQLNISHHLNGRRNSDYIAMGPSGGVIVGKSSEKIPSGPSSHLSGGRKHENNSSSPSGGLIVGKSGEKSPSGPSSHLSGGRKHENNSSSPSGGNPSVRRNTEQKVVNNIHMLEIGEKKTLKPPAASLFTRPSVTRVTNLKPMRYQNSKVSSPRLNRKKTGKAVPDIEEKIEETLSVIKPKPECEIFEPSERNETINQSSPSSLLLSSLSSCPSVSSNEEEYSKESESELIEGGNIVYKHDKTETNSVNHLKSRENTRPRMSKMIHPENSVPEKFRFQRGKLVSHEPVSNGSKRLKFRPGRVVGENKKSLDSGNSSMKRLKFRQGRVVGVIVNPSSKVDIGMRSLRNQDLGGDNTNATKAETPAVVLRHQDMQGKKEDQGLLNHVIEETATKLVETKKSKVKALVGAFETVISLQGSKPVTNV